MTGLKDLANVLRATSTLGGGRGPSERRGRFAERRFLEQEAETKASEKKLEFLNQRREALVKMVSDPDKQPQNRQAIEGAIRELDTAIVQLGGVATGALPTFKEQDALKRKDLISKYTPESIEKFEQSGEGSGRDMKLLEPVSGEKTTTITKLQTRRDTLEKQLSSETDKNKKNGIQRSINEIQKRIDKETSIVGRTEFDKSELTNSQRGKAVQNFTDKKVASRKFVTLSNKIIDGVKNNAAKLGVVGAISRIAGEVKSIAQNISSQFGVDTSEISREIDDYNFGNLASASAEFKTDTLTLALIFASATGLGEGRALTNKDVQRAIDAIGASTNDAGQLIARMKTIQKNLDDSLWIEAEEGDFDYQGIPEMWKEEEKDIKDMSVEELLNAF